MNNGTVDAIGGSRLAGSLSGSGVMEGSFALPASQVYDENFVSPSGVTSSIGIYTQRLAARRLSRVR